MFEESCQIVLLVHEINLTVVDVICNTLNSVSNRQDISDWKM